MEKYIRDVNNYNQALHRRELWRQKINLCLMFTILSQNDKRRRRSQKRRMWVSRILQLMRPINGFYHTISPELSSDEVNFSNYFRMSVGQFEELLRLTAHRINKQDFIRTPIPAAERLALTLRFLATGDCFSPMKYQYSIAQPTISGIIHETCNILWDILKPIVLAKPDRNSWAKIADDFEKLWNFPHCCGAIDRRHIEIDCPPESGSQYDNYKGYNSVVLMAVCDAKYLFTCVEIAACGRRGNSAIFNQGIIGRCLTSGTMNLPETKELYEDGPILPYFFVGDEAFPLSTSLLRPYSGRNELTNTQKIFNYRLSRARRTIENTFGIVVSKWRVLRKPIECQVEVARDIVKAIVCLHNWLGRSNSTTYIESSLLDREDQEGNFFPGSWRQINDHNGLLRQHPYNFLDNTNNSALAKEVRDEFCRFFDEEGEVPWQFAAVDYDSEYE